MLLLYGREARHYCAWILPSGRSYFVFCSVTSAPPSAVVCDESRLNVGDLETSIGDFFGFFCFSSYILCSYKLQMSVE